MAVNVRQLIELLKNYDPELDVGIKGLDGLIDYIDEVDFEIIKNKDVDDDLIILDQSNYAPS